VQCFDDASALVEILPEFPGIEEMQLLFGVAKQLANARVVEQQPAVLVDHIEPGRTVFENLPKLPLVLCNIRVERTVNRA